MATTEYVPSVEQYLRAFRSIAPKLTKKQREMLRFQLSARRPVTSTELATLVGYKDWRGVNSQYGRVGAMLRAEGRIFAGMSGQASAAFASFDKIPRKDKRYSEWLWTLHEPARTAMLELGWALP
jgi:hypothetical protein